MPSKGILDSPAIFGDLSPIPAAFDAASRQHLSVLLGWINFWARDLGGWAVTIDPAGTTSLCWNVLGPFSGGRLFSDGALYNTVGLETGVGALA